jgi:hypothetical protein
MWEVKNIQNWGIGNILKIENHCVRVLIDLNTEMEISNLLFKNYASIKSWDLLKLDCGGGPRWLLYYGRFLSFCVPFLG